MTTESAARATSFPVGETTRPGYLALPEGQGPFPAVVVIHEILGLNDQIKATTRRFATAGYAALAVDLFAGQNRLACMIRTIANLQRRPFDSGSLDELKSALSYLAALPEVDEARLGAIGFCMGGGFCIAWACTDNRLKAVAPYYGSNPKPLEKVRDSCAVVGSYPGRDITRPQGRKLDEALARYNIPHDIKTYPGALHSFFNESSRLTYNQAAAEDSWNRVMSFFEEHMPAPAASPTL